MAPPSHTPPPGLDPLFYAQMLFRRGAWDACVAVCDGVLAQRPTDTALWFVKCRALTEKVRVDDDDVEDEDAGAVLLADDATAALPRPGTSLARGRTAAQPGSGGGAHDAAFRPMTRSGRPATGFARPATGGGRPGTTDLRGARPGSAAAAAALLRPVTAAGRHVRVGTASLAAAANAGGGAFLAVDRLDLRRYAARPSLARALHEYIVAVDRNPRKALELAAAASEAAGYADWWWKLRCGAALAAVGLLREAGEQLRSALRAQATVVGVLELGRVALRLDQPTAARAAYAAGAAAFPADTSCALAAARLHERLGEADAAAALYRSALATDATCVEAVASLAASAFYGGAPEVAAALYRRLLQLAGAGGPPPAELWNNLGLCTFATGQLDLTLRCFERALAGAATDGDRADVYFNLGHVGLGLGDTGWALQAFRVALALEPAHAEAANNVGVLEARRGGGGGGGGGGGAPSDAARASFAAAAAAGDHLYEPRFNGALLAARAGDVADALRLVRGGLELYPGHAESRALEAALGAALEAV